MKRLTFLLVCAALFGAGCFANQPSASVQPNQTPQPAATSTVQTATTTPVTQAMPGTEQWQGYKNHAYGFGFKYPSEAINKFQIDTATGTVLTLDLGPTVASTTAVSTPEATLDVKVIAQDGKDLPVGGNLKNGCYDELGGNVQIVPKVNYAGQDVCVASASDAGAGNYYHSYWYTVPLKDKYLVMAFTIHSVNCDNYDNPAKCIAFDESRDSLTAKMIMSTFNLFEPTKTDLMGLQFEPKSIVKGNKTYEMDFNYPFLKQGTPDLQQAVNSAVKEYVNTTTAGFLEYVKESKDYPGPGPFTLDVDYSVPFVSPGIVNIVFDGYEFTGGAHGMHIYRTFVFDVATGKLLGLQDLFADKSEYLKTISDFSSQEITKRNVSDADWIKTGTAPDKDNYQYFYLTQDGLSIIFPPYQVASYADGEQDVLMPYDQLSAILKPDIKQALGL